MIGWLFDLFFVGSMIEVRRDSPTIFWSLILLLLVLGVGVLALAFHLGGW